MPSWKKVIISGSDASLNSLNITNAVTASVFTGSFVGDGSGLTDISYNSITNKEEFIQIACSNLTTAITTGAKKAYFRMPFAMTVTSITGSMINAPTGSHVIIDINENGSTIMTTNKLRIDASEKTSVTATTFPTITDTLLANDSEITIDFDQVGSTYGGAGVIVTIKGTI